MIRHQKQSLCKKVLKYLPGYDILGAVLRSEFLKQVKIILDRSMVEHCGEFPR